MYGLEYFWKHFSIFWESEILTDWIQVEHTAFALEKHEFRTSSKNCHQFWRVTKHLGLSLSKTSFKLPTLVNAGEHNSSTAVKRKAENICVTTNKKGFKIEAKTKKKVLENQSTSSMQRQIDSWEEGPGAIISNCHKSHQINSNSWIKTQSDMSLTEISSWEVTAVSAEEKK